MVADGVIVKAGVIKKPVPEVAKLIQPEKERRRIQVKDDLRALNC